MTIIFVDWEITALFAWKAKQELIDGMSPPA